MTPSSLIFCSLFILNILDCLTGWYKAKVLKKENSKSGYKGIINKIRRDSKQSSNGNNKRANFK